MTTLAGAAIIAASRAADGMDTLSGANWADDGLIYCVVFMALLILMGVVVHLAWGKDHDE
jgi:tryptophan-rich sensory protein